MKDYRLASPLLGCLGALLAFFPWTSGCDQATNALMMIDLSLPSGGGGDMGDNPGGDDMTVEDGADLAAPPPLPTTIRDLNKLAVPMNTRVKFTGVVTSPLTLANVGADRKSCVYTIVVGQFDATPTLQDGIIVVGTRAAAAPTTDQCQADGATSPIVKAAMGDTLQVVGTIVIQNPRRFVQTVPEGVKDLGPVNADLGTTAPQPVAADLKSFVPNNAMQYKDAQAALVQFTCPRTSDRNAFSQTFDLVSKDGLSKVTIDPSYLQLVKHGYLAPDNGSLFRSVTGVVSVRNNSIWPRNDMDFVLDTMKECK